MKDSAKYWASDGLLLSGPVFTIVGVWFLLVIGWGESQIRYTGLALQLLGFGAAVRGASKTLRDFGKPGLRSLVKESWLNRPKRLKRVEVDAHIALEALSTAAAEATGNLSVGASTTEGRVSILEGQFRNLERTIGDNHRQTLQLIKEQAAIMQHAQREIALKTSALGDQIDLAATGPIKLSLFGVFLLVLGTILATIPSEITELACRV